MTPVFQTRFGTEGNCWAACLASLFDVQIEEVDHCACNHADWLEQTDKWLATRGFFYTEWMVDDKASSPVFHPRIPEGALVILGVFTERGHEHVVIAECHYPEPGKQQYHLVHDPLPPDRPGADAAITELRCIIFIAPIFRNGGEACG